MVSIDLKLSAEPGSCLSKSRLILSTVSFPWRQNGTLEEPLGAWEVLGKVGEHLLLRILHCGNHLSTRDLMQLLLVVEGDLAIPNGPTAWQQTLLLICLQPGGPLMFTVRCSLITCFHRCRGLQACLQLISLGVFGDDRKESSEITCQQDCHTSNVACCPSSPEVSNPLPLWPLCGTWCTHTRRWVLFAAAPFAIADVLEMLHIGVSVLTKLRGT